MEWRSSYMNAREIRWELHNYHANKDEIEKLKSELEEYRKMDMVKAQVITKMPIVRNNNSTKIESLIEYIGVLELELHTRMRMNKAIESVYATLKEPARTIIEMRYFLLPQPNDIRQRKYNWAEIAEEINYSEIYCYKVDKNVVLKIQNELCKFVENRSTGLVFADLSN